MNGIKNRANSKLEKVNTVAGCLLHKQPEKLNADTPPPSTTREKYTNTHGVRAWRKC